MTTYDIGYSKRKGQDTTGKFNNYNRSEESVKTGSFLCIKHGFDTQRRKDMQNEIINEIIDTETIIDEQLNPEMLDELSNGKGDDE